MATTHLNLGANERLSCFRFPVLPSRERCLEIIRLVIHAIGMTVDGPPDIREYPNQHGQGGEGVQIYQPLVESFMVIGTWPAHGFTRIYLASCKPYEVDKINKLLAAILKCESDMTGHFDF
jgi:S-adenosylmethionine/arginine decarboxylase-like enzyme